MKSALIDTRRSRRSLKNEPTTIWQILAFVTICVLIGAGLASAF